MKRLLILAAITVCLKGAPVWNPVVLGSSYLLNGKATFVVFTDSPPGTGLAIVDTGSAVVPLDIKQVILPDAIVIDNLDGHSSLYPQSLIFTNRVYEVTPRSAPSEVPEPQTFALAMAGMLLIGFAVAVRALKRC